MHLPVAQFFGTNCVQMLPMSRLRGMWPYRVRIMLAQSSRLFSLEHQIQRIKLLRDRPRRSETRPSKFRFGTPIIRLWPMTMLQMHLSSQCQRRRPPVAVSMRYFLEVAHSLTRLPSHRRRARMRRFDSAPAFSLLRHCPCCSGAVLPVSSRVMPRHFVMIAAPVHFRPLSISRAARSVRQAHLLALAPLRVSHVRLALRHRCRVRPRALCAL